MKTIIIVAALLGASCKNLMVNETELHRNYLLLQKQIVLEGGVSTLDLDTIELSIHYLDSILSIGEPIGKIQCPDPPDPCDHPDKGFNCLTKFKLIESPFEIKDFKIKMGDLNKTPKSLGSKRTLALSKKCGPKSFYKVNLVRNSTITIEKYFPPLNHIISYPVHIGK